MFNCLTKLPKFECLKNLGKSSLPNLSAEGTKGRKKSQSSVGAAVQSSSHAGERGSSPRKESPSSDHLMRSSVVGSETILIPCESSDKQNKRLVGGRHLSGRDREGHSRKELVEECRYGSRGRLVGPRG